MDINAAEIQSYLKAIMDGSPDPIFIKDRQSRFLLVNPAFLITIGKGKQEVIGRDDYEVFDAGEIADALLANDRMVMETGRSHRLEERVMTPAGPRTYLTTKSPFRNSEGEIVGVIGIARDISDRLRAEEALRESESRLRVFIEHAPAALAMFDTQMRYISVSRRWITDYGLDKHELIGKSHYDIFPGITEYWREAHRRGLQGEVIRAEEDRFERSDGSVQWLRWEVRPWTDSAGNVAGIVIFTEDITDIKNAEETMQRGEALLRSVLEQMPSGVIVRDARTGEILLTNARIREILGELVNYPDEFGSYCGSHPDGRPYRTDEWPITRSMKTGEIVHSEEVSCRRNDGTPIILSISSAPIRDSNGNIILGAAVFHDITERKLAEGALRDSEEKYRRLVETANEGILQVDLDLKTIYVNSRMAQMLGYAPKEIVGRVYSDFTDPAERENNAKRFENRRKGIAEIYECRMMRKDGSKFWALVSASPLHDRAGNWLGSLGMYTDIHKRKQMERALRALNETLEQRVAVRTAEARRMADQLRALATELSQAEQRERRRLATILHDHIQQLLVAARLQLEWLGHEPEPGRIKAATQGIDAVLKEAIAASRSLTIDLSPPVLHQAGLVGGLSWLASRMLEKNQFTVHLRADTNAEPPTEEMRLLLFECVRELLFNAVKHSGVNESDVTLMRVSNDRIRIVVQDLGKGFDPDRLRNRRPNEATYGLFSIQQRLAHIGGHVEIETGVGRGTKVTLTVQAGRPAAKTSVEKAVPSGIDVRGKEDACRVLIVDDHKILRDGLRGLLQFEEGIEVVGEASDGPGGITQAEVLVPDVIIMDINLKDMSGIEATRAILAKNPGIRVIGLSMHLDVNAARAMREAGAVAYVPKGGPSEDLIAAIRACFHDKINNQ